LHPFQPFIIGQRIIGPLFSQKFNVPLVMYGENQAEYGNNINENNSPEMSYDFFANKNPTDIKLGGLKISEILDSTDFQLKDFTPYIPPKSDDLKRNNLEVHYLGYYLKWDPQECFYYASENTGFRPNTERTIGTYSKYSSIDDQIDFFHYYTTLIKFGIGRATYDASQEIRNGKITREEAVALVRQYDQEFPEKYLKFFLEYIDISQEQFESTIDKFRPPHLWRKKNSSWILKHVVENL
jgi:hypothetical protein